jgi:hypothetical protein
VKKLVSKAAFRFECDLRRYAVARKFRKREERDVAARKKAWANEAEEAAAAAAAAGSAAAGSEAAGGSAAAGAKKQN